MRAMAALIGALAVLGLGGCFDDGPESGCGDRPDEFWDEKAQRCRVDPDPHADDADVDATSRAAWDRYDEDMADAEATEISATAAAADATMAADYATMDAEAATDRPTGANALDCPDFTSQRAAQAVLDADPGDPHWLDDDGDGIACEWLP